MRTFKIKLLKRNNMEKLISSKKGHNNSNLETIYSLTSELFPVCLVNFKGQKIDLNAKNRITSIQLHIFDYYNKGKGVFLPPIKAIISIKLCNNKVITQQLQPLY